MIISIMSIYCLGATLDPEVIDWQVCSLRPDRVAV